MVVTWIFNKIYLKNRFSHVLRIEGDDPKNLISFSHIIICAMIILFDIIMIFVGKINGEPDVPYGACSYLFFASVCMGTIANEVDIKSYFYHYLQQVYYSSPLLQQVHTTMQLNGRRIGPTAPLNIVI